MDCRELLWFTVGAVGYCVLLWHAVATVGYHGVCVLRWAVAYYCKLLVTVGCCWPMAAVGYYVLVYAALVDLWLLWVTVNAVVYLWLLWVCATVGYCGLLWAAVGIVGVPFPTVRYCGLFVLL